MPHFISINEKVRSLDIGTLKPRHAYKGAMVVVSERVTLIKTRDGRLLTNLPRAAYTPAVYNFSRELFRALRLVGALTAEDERQHIEHCAGVDARRNAKYDLENICERFAKHDMKVPKRMLDKLARTAGLKSGEVKTIIEKAKERRKL